jgi:hypothetical protein
VRRCAFYALSLVVIAACGARSNSAQVFRTAPNPNGCYAQLFSGEQFRGARDYVNGPWRIPDLRSEDRWKDGVRSLRTGPGTTVTLWSDANYRGSLFRVSSDKRDASVNNALGGVAASLQISCN